jgi:hypothetical protein
MAEPREKTRYIPLTGEDGRFVAVSIDGTDWVVVTEDARLVGAFRSVAVTTPSRLEAQALAVIAGENCSGTA